MIRANGSGKLAPPERLPTISTFMPEFLLHGRPALHQAGWRPQRCSSAGNPSINLELDPPRPPVNATKPAV